MSVNDPLQTFTPGGTAQMAKRAGLLASIRDLENWSREELIAELDRSYVQLSMVGSARTAQRWRKRIQWLESALGQREAPHLSFTNLERRVLDAICVAQRDALPQLRDLLAHPKVLGRDNTGHGFYTSFDLGTMDDLLNWPRPISGPTARMIDMGEGALMGFLLWCDADKPSTLEGYQLGSQVDLKTRDLAGLRFTALEWL